MNKGVLFHVQKQFLFEKIFTEDNIFLLTDIKVWHYLSVYRAQRLTNRDIINYFFFPLKLQDPQLIEVVPFFQCTELC